MRDEHPFFKWRIELKEYDKHYHFFSQRLFHRNIAERILKIASLTVWDVYHLFTHGSSLAQGATYLEIGSHLGGSMLSVAYGAESIQRCITLKAIDKNFPKEFLVNTRHINYLELIESVSELAEEQISNNSIDLLFIDGDHRYKFVEMDINNYWPKLKPGGVLLGHDYKRMDGVREAVNERFGKEKISLLTNSDIWKVQK